MGRLDRVLFINVRRPPLEREILFHLEKRLLIFSRTPFQMAFTLKMEPKGRPKHVIGSWLGYLTPQNTNQGLNPWHISN